MDKREEFDREDEYDFDPNEILDEEAVADDLNLPEETEDYGDDDLDRLLSDEFLASLGITIPKDDAEPESTPVDEEMTLFAEESEAEDTDADTDYEDLDEDLSDALEQLQEDDDVKEYPAKSEPAFEMEPELDEEFIKTFEEVFPPEQTPDEQDQPPVPVVELDTKQEEVRIAPANPRRRKMSRERIIKEVYLPPAIAALTLILVLVFIGSAIGRAIRTNQALEESLQASQDAQASALQQEADVLVAQANALADGYDYDAALALLDTFPGDKSQYQNVMDAINRCAQEKSKIKPIDDPNSIPNLSFHCLIADPARAFTDKDWGQSYNTNYVTIDEFSKILDQLYANGYVLVDFDSFIVETVGDDGKITYSTQPIYLPEGKKPFMLTETLVNYELFTVDSDGDLEADKGGDGFASKLIIDANGKIVNEYVDAQGNTLYGAYDLVPILEAFIAEHPDFSYRGARAILAVTGEDGVFGYRTMLSAKDKKGEDYYNAQVDGAKKIAQALRDAGYTIACYTYANVPYGTLSATKIQVDLDNWKKEVKPVLGDVPVLVYAKASDISADGNYEGGNKYNVLKDNGFRYFISSANVPYADVTVNYIRQSRIMVTGQQMIVKPEIFSKYFTAKDVLNEHRGN